MGKDRRSATRFIFSTGQVAARRDGDGSIGNDSWEERAGWNGGHQFPHRRPSIGPMLTFVSHVDVR